MIKVMVPSAPSAEAILPYLQEIDANRWYSNGGPLVRRLEARMGGVAVSSATLGLEIMSRLLFKKKRVRIPAFTFVATATALIRAGFDPVLCDVGPSWMLEDLDEQSLPVCAFGAPVAHDGLVDAAAAWGNQSAGARVFSLHATKSLSAGEGGMICASSEVLERVRRLANFGLDSSSIKHGIVTECGTNAKMSEYNAAVGLASLDMWPQTEKRVMAMTKRYLDTLGDVEVQPRPPGVYTTFPVLVRNAEGVAFDMASRGVETRRWYTPTLDQHPAFQHLPKEGSLGNVRRLGAEVLCLPFHRYLSESDIDQVCEVFQWAVKRNTPMRTFSLPITRAARASTASQSRI